MLILFILLNTAGCKSEKDQLPNIIIILTDDQGYADLSVYGADDFETPNIDQLAAEGIRFTDFYVSEAVSTSSRASLLTGSLAQRIGLSGIALTPLSMKGLNPEEQTIPSLLKQKDYATAIYGKWHLGSQNEFFPHQHGFDEYVGLPYSNDMWPYTYHGEPITDGYRTNYPPLYVYEDTVPTQEITSLNDQSKLTGLYTEKAVSFINKNKDKPFFLYVPHSMPHTPIAASEKFKGTSQQGEYGDVIQEIDWSVGKIMNALKANNIDEQTLVIFVSDNGPWMNFGNHAGSADPLREGKGSMWEGGCRVPCVMRWPGEIPAGKVIEQMAASVDLLPTIAQLTETKLAGNEIDGLSIVPYLLGEDADTIRNHYAYYYGGQLQAVRKNDWKLYFPHKYRSYEGVEPGMDGTPGNYNFKTCGIELYNLKDDISETRILNEQYPQIVEELSQLADSFRIILGDRLNGQLGTNNREPGRLGFKKEQIEHLAIGKIPSLENKYNNKYSAGGEKALTDGKAGSLDLFDDRWMGFQGDDVIATLNMDKESDISEIKCNFLRNQNSWVFLPKSMTIEISMDGANFNEIFSEKFDSEIENKEAKILTVGKTGLDFKAQYIRITAKNIGPCPAWHPGFGNDAWLFVDEIVVR